MTMPHLTLDGTRFYYQQAGQGPDVVLIHAITSNLAVWMFIGIVETLAAEFRVTVYDMRGHGNSDCPATGYTSADMASDFKKLHTGLGLGPAYLVGHSFGAVVAMHAAVLYPDAVAGVILADPFFPGLSHIEPNIGESHVWQELKEQFQRCGMDLGDEVNFGKMFRLATTMTPEQKEQVKRHMDAGWQRWLSQLPRLAATTCGEDLFAVAGLTAERIGSVRQPVVALYDEHTPFQATRRYLEQHLLDGTLDVVPGAKHVAPLQNPMGFIQSVQRHLRALVHQHKLRA
jgi:pimeloyl-ACP methyl ester carboxylesterase